ncbi:MAG: S8 family serine peptidase [Bacteroidales bacterium]
MRTYLFILLYALLLMACKHAIPQSEYWVFFKDKEGVEFRPSEYFDSKTIDRRKAQGISVNQSTDRPVSQDYIDEIEQYAKQIHSISRWLNAVKIKIDEKQVKALNSLSFIDSVKMVNQHLAHNHSMRDSLSSLASGDESLINRQLDHFQGGLFKEEGVDGSGVRIAVFDAGFANVQESKFFRHLFDNNKIKATYDFVRNEEDVFHRSSHGTMVLSCLTGQYEDRQLGLATGAEFLLARTEHAHFEPFSEEENWVEALEWAEKNGADIITSSLGYTNKRYFKEDMDGSTSLVAKVAKMALSKGLLVIVSVGNEGSSKWKVLSTPADVDSVVSVGGLNPNTRLHTSFSSFGPNANMFLKPTLTAFGHVIAESPTGLTRVQGTSFSAPLVAGFAACVWQMYPEWSNMKLFEALCASGDLYPYYDYAHGYGVPQASYFLDSKRLTLKNNFFLNVRKKRAVVRIQKKAKPGSNYFPYMFYHITDEENHLKEYAVIDPQGADTVNIDLKTKYSGHLLRVFYAGEIREIPVP